MELPKEKDLSMIKRYPIETLVIILLCGICTLGVWILQINTKVNQLQESRINYYSGSNEILIKALDNSTRAIERSNQTNERVYNALFEFKTSKTP